MKAYVGVRKPVATEIDESDLDLIEGFYWCYDGRYVVRPGVQGKRRKPLHTEKTLHRAIAARSLGDIEGKLVDHKNGDKLDNRRENLRLADKSQNGWNRLKCVNNTTGYKGVTLFKRTGKYIAQIKVYGKNYHLGYYDTAEEAAEMYDLAAKAWHGEYYRA